MTTLREVLWTGLSICFSVGIEIHHILKITSLVDNISSSLCGSEHGLSLYIELNCGIRVLFDMGQGSLFAENASILGIDLSSVDVAVISHGHYDHGGGLGTFLNLNSKAGIYIGESSFCPHFSVKEYGLKDIGIDKPSCDRINCCGQIEYLPYGITLFGSTSGDFPEPDGNRLLLGRDGRPDDFCHERNMIIREDGNVVLFGGCGHRGIVNIINDAQKLFDGSVNYVLSGMHLCGGMKDDDYPEKLARALLSFDSIQYYTMHCTGEDGFLRLKGTMHDRISYLACGESVTI